MDNWKKILKKDISEIVDVNREDLEMLKESLYQLFLEYPELVKNCFIPDVVGRSEQLPESEKLCRMNQNFVCNCIDDSRCPNF